MDEKKAVTAEEREPLLTGNYYAVIPAPVFFDKSLTANEKLFYGVLSCLSQTEGYCWATNARLATAFSCGGHEVSDRTVERWLATLKKNGHILTQNLTRKGKVVGRRIYMRTALPNAPAELDISDVLDEISPRKNAEAPQKCGNSPRKNAGHNNINNNKTKGASALYDFVRDGFNADTDDAMEELKSAINAFCEMRQKKRTPLTTLRAVKQTAKKLLEYSGGDIQTAIAVLDQSTERSYTTVYPLKTARPEPEPQRREEELW